MSAGLDPSTLPADVSVALRGLFGNAPIGDLAVMGGGLSRAMLLSFTIGGVSYVLRKGEVARAPRELACLRIASAREVAPRLFHADVETGICIMEHLAGAPLGGALAPDPERLARVAATLRRLHDGPAFPIGPTVADVVADIELQMPARAGARLPAEIARTLEGVASCLVPYARAAPCHNDLNPNNVIEASGRIYFVDWETAGAGDPFIDLAQLGVFAFPRPEQRDALLEAYLARAPTERETSRAIVARVVALALYAAAFSLVAASSQGSSPLGEPRPLAAPASLDALRSSLAVSRERTDPGVLAAVLLREMREESAADAFVAARARLMEC